MRSISIIIPTYNEAQNIPLLVEEFFSVVSKDTYDIELIIVDDNSPDGTAAVAEKLANTYPVKVIKRSGKLGLGSAVRAGFVCSDREVLGVMDADLSHDPVILPKMIDELENHDIAIGSRFQEESSVEQWNSAWRKFLSYAGVAGARITTGCKDPLTGYFILRRSVIEGVPLQTKGYKILFEILVKGRYDSFVEIPFVFRDRRFSTSKLNWKEYLLFLGQIVSYTFWKLTHRKKR